MINRNQFLTWWASNQTWVKNHSCKTIKFDWKKWHKWQKTYNLYIKCQKYAVILCIVRYLSDAYVCSPTSEGCMIFGALPTHGYFDSSVFACLFPLDFFTLQKSAFIRSRRFDMPWKVQSGYSCVRIKSHDARFFINSHISVDNIYIIWYTF